MLVLLALQLPCHIRTAAGTAGAALLSAGSFFLYLAHPMLLPFFPVMEPGGGLARWGYLAGMLALCGGVCYLLYGLFVRRFEGLFAGRR